jgi:hypothetical protein
MKYQSLVDGGAGDHELLLGNEAAVRGHSKPVSVLQPAIRGPRRPRSATCLA